VYKAKTNNRRRRRGGKKEEVGKTRKDNKNSPEKPDESR
jgi:hypothetical protein